LDDSTAKQEGELAKCIVEDASGDHNLEVKRLRAENEALKNHLEKAMAETPEEVKRLQAEYIKLKSKLTSEQTECETNLRNLVLKNQEVIEMWTKSKTMTKDELVAVEL
jgi:ABC-type phosphate transport system auxiliary subunit